MTKMRIMMKIKKEILNLILNKIIKSNNNLYKKTEKIKIK